MSKKIERRMANAIKLFGFTEKPSHADWRARYRELAMKHHPDRGGSEGNFKKINWANDIMQRHGFLDEQKQESAAMAPEEQAEEARPSGLGGSSSEPDSIGSQESESASIGSAGSDPLLLGTEGGGSGSTPDLSSMLSSGSEQPWAADAQHMEGPEPPPMAQILGEGGDEAMEPLQQPSGGKKKRQKAEPPDWGKFLGGLGKGIGTLGKAFDSDTLSSIGGGMQGISQIMGSVGKFADLFGGGEQGSESGGLGDTITNVLGGGANGGQGSASSTSSADPSDDLQKAIEKLTDAVTLLIEKMGGQAAPGGVGGTQMPAGGSLGGTGGGDMGDIIKQIMQIMELIATMSRMLAMAAA